MVLVFLQYIEYEITDVSVVFIGEFRAWRTDKTEYSLFPEGKFEIDGLTEANSIVAFGTYWRRQENRRSQID
jgi:hypothetical protein